MTLKLPPALEMLIGKAEAFTHLEQALTHPSFANEHRHAGQNDYQRLEFLGDAVLGLGVSESLMGRFPEAREGELSVLRASIVSTEALASYARTVSLGEALQLGKGADSAGEREQVSVLADALEAVIAAVYLDRGFAEVRQVVESIVVHGLSSPRPTRDPKSELQERVQSRGSASPRYRLVATTGPDHQREFVVEVEAWGSILGEGRGRSKKAAEQAAARAGLDRLIASNDGPNETSSSEADTAPKAPA